MNKKAIKYISENHGDIQGKTIIITGGNSGIGFESAKYFCYLGAKVIITARNLSRGNDALKLIKEEVPTADISLMELDISHEESIKSFVDKIIKDKIDIDIFYHNAGVYRLPFELIENKDIITNTNFYGPLILNSLLLPYLHSLNHDVKMLITSSLATKWTTYKKISLLPNDKQSKMIRYSNSKLLDAFLFKYLLENDHKNIHYYLVHPGFSNTGLIKKAYKDKFTWFFVNLYATLCSNPVWKSSLSAIAVTQNGIKDGEFLGPNFMFNFLGYPKHCKFIDKQYVGVNEVIKESEKIVGYKLLD